MPLAHAAWVHAAALEVEYPERVESQARMGFACHVRGRAGTDNWIHFAIPTPVIVQDRRLKAGSVMLRFKSSDGALVHAVHIYDGERRIAAHDGLSVQPSSWSAERYSVPGSPEVQWGLGISVGVRFPAAGGQLDFSSAGCDFLS
jgi:hypothetical protein